MSMLALFRKPMDAEVVAMVAMHADLAREELQDHPDE